MLAAHAAEDGRCLRRPPGRVIAVLIAIATCAELPDLDEDERRLIDALLELGAEAQPAVWDDPSIDWGSFDAVILRATWDYSRRLEEFIAWTRRVASVTALLNPADIVEWNTDKRYLSDLAAAGVPIVPTAFLEPSVLPGSAADPVAWAPPAGFAEFVVKPVVSAGSRDTMRYSPATSGDAPDLHVRRLLAAGEAVMIQPYLEAVDTIGETALVFIGGEFSHAIRKGQMLRRDTEGEKVAGLYVIEDIKPRAASPAERAVADAALAVIPGGLDRVLYARVDLIPDASGAPVVLELELTEPSLFFQHDHTAAPRLAAAILARL